MKKRSRHFERCLGWVGWIAAVTLAVNQETRGQTGHTVTWAGGSSLQSWAQEANWIPQAVPFNNPETNFTVIVPDGTSLSYDVAASGAVDALSFGYGSHLLIANGQQITVTGVAILKGLIDARGAGSALHAPANTVVLSGYPRFGSADGAQIKLGASSYNWNSYPGSFPLLSAIGPASLVDLSQVTAAEISPGDGVGLTYSITARNDGVVDLSGLTSLAGPGSDDVLEINIGEGGVVKLDHVGQISGNVVFNVGPPGYQLPAATGLYNSVFNVSPGATFHLPRAQTIAGSTFNVSENGIVDAPGLTTMDGVSVNLVTDAAFVATNLVAYRNSDLAVAPGRDFRSGLLADIFGSRIHISGGIGYRVGATSYEVPWDWRTSPTLFSCQGAGSVLDLTSIKSLRVPGGAGTHWQWDPGVYTYSISTVDHGVIDFSGLETIRGAEVNDLGANDWLKFIVSDGGSILLTGLKQVTGRTEFDIRTSGFSLPSVESVDNTHFRLSDGIALNVPALDRLDNCWLSFGFNSSFNALQLRHFLNSDLSIFPGAVFNAPAITNLNGSRIAVTSGMTWQCMAPSYETPGNWNWSPTMFSADGNGSILDLSAMKTLVVHGGADSAYTYTIAASNNGALDLGGVETVQGAEGDDWLVVALSSGGTIDLSRLRQINGRTRFALGSGSRLDLPSLASVSAGCRIDSVANTEINAPNLVECVGCEINLEAGGAFASGVLSNLFASRLAIRGGRVLAVGATAYETPWDWRTDATLFKAEDPGSRLDLSAMQSLRVYGGGRTDWWEANAYVYSIFARNQGVISLSGLRFLYGADTENFDGNDLLDVRASSGGVIEFGNVSVTRRVALSATDPNSTLDFGGLQLAAPASLYMGAGSILRVRGDFWFDLSDTNGLVTEFARVHMDGNTRQRLEVGGRDVGPLSAVYQRNFGFSQLVIGRTNQPSVVQLADQIDNGGRGSSGEAEALYLYGLEDRGLRLLPGSTLVLGGLNCYATVDGQMVNLNAVIPPGSNSVAFDAGFVARMRGPRVTALTPSLVRPPFSSADVTFDMAIAPTSFGIEDVAISGPNGPVPASAVEYVGGTTWRIRFAAQTDSGTYSFRVGPNIDEIAGNLHGMDQDGNAVGGEAPGDVFSGVVVVDGVPPAIQSAYALQNGTRVGVTFTERVDEATATNPAIYSVDGRIPSQAVLQPNGRDVLLTVSPMVGDSFSLNVRSLGDVLGNSADVAVAGTILPLSMMDVGTPGSTPVEAGATWTFDGVDFEMSSGGLDGSYSHGWWNGVDAGQFAFEQRTGDFDVQVQVARLEGSSYDSQAGIMWRQSADAGASRVYVCVNAAGARNRYWAYVRSPSVGNSYFVLDASFPAVPNAWIRLKRVGQEFIAFSGSDGIGWTEQGRWTSDLPATGLLGIACDGRNNAPGALMSATFRNYGDINPVIVAQPQSQSVASDSDVVFGAMARGLPLLAYQWFFNGSAIAGATGSLLTLSSVGPGDAGDYFVVVTNAYGSVTSQVATLVVDGVGTGGFEGDVSPEPFGNNAVTVADWVKVGRFVAGLDSPATGSQYMRADCAPRANEVEGTLPLGDARLTVGDWTQAGRYAAGLDPLTPAGGANGPAPGALFKPISGEKPEGAPPAPVPLKSRRIVRMEGATIVPGQVFSIPIIMQGTGEENAVGFTVRFDPAHLSFQRVAPVDDSAGLALQVNTHQAAAGRLGMVLARPTGKGFSSGDAALVRMEFSAIGQPGITTSIDFGDSPVFREVVDLNAEPLAAEFASARVSLVRAGNLECRVGAGVGLFELLLYGLPGQTYRVEASGDLSAWTVLATETLGTSPVTVIDRTNPLLERRFYRAVRE